MSVPFPALNMMTSNLTDDILMIRKKSSLWFGYHNIGFGFVFDSSLLSVYIVMLVHVKCICVHIHVETRNQSEGSLL